MTTQNDPLVAVMYDGLDPSADDEPHYVALDVLRVLYRLMGNDFEAAWKVIQQGRGVVIGPVFLSAGRIAVNWIESEGGAAFIDDGAYYAS